jgi:DNA-binding NtrC family response regulator
MEWAFAFQEENGEIAADAFERFFQTPSPAVSPTAGDDGSLRDMMDRFEARMVREALARNDNNVSATARTLGLSRQMLHEKIKKYGIATRED